MRNPSPRHAEVPRWKVYYLAGTSRKHPMTHAVAPWVAGPEAAPRAPTEESMQPWTGCSCPSVRHQTSSGSVMWALPASAEELFPYLCIHLFRACVWHPRLAQCLLRSQKRQRGGNLGPQPRGRVERMCAVVSGPLTTGHTSLCVSPTPG